MSTATALVVLGAAGTAVAAGTGNLPTGLQQRAHRLFSALGVPAPRTGPTSATPSTTKSTSTRTPAAAPTRTPSPANPSPVVVPAEHRAWCLAWRAADDGGRPMNGRDRRDLIAAAGGAEKVPAYCARLIGTTAPTPSATTTTAPGKSGSHRATPSHPTPRATTPSHPGGKK